MSKRSCSLVRLVVSGGRRWHVRHEWTWAWASTKTHMYHKWNVSVSLIILYIINFYFSRFVQRTPSSLPPTLSFGTFTLVKTFTCAQAIVFFPFSSFFYFRRIVFFFSLDSITCIVLAHWAFALHPLCVIPMPNGVVLSDQVCEALKWHSIWFVFFVQLPSARSTSLTFDAMLFCLCFLPLMGTCSKYFLS